MNGHLFLKHDNILVINQVQSFVAMPHISVQEEPYKTQVEQVVLYQHHHCLKDFVQVPL